MTMPTRLETLQTRLAAYQAAELKILTEAQAYQVGDGSAARQLERARLETIRAGIKDLQTQIDAVAPETPRRMHYLRSY